jgi:hypothetical protein
MFEFFGQDSWRVNQKLKLELGFRATWMNGYAKSLWGNMAYFDPAKYDPNSPMVIDRGTGNIISGDRYNGVVIPGVVPRRRPRPRAGDRFGPVRPPALGRQPLRRRRTSSTWCPASAWPIR